ncbi:hypothetical protein [Allorhizobium taibaishanense]|uniref:Amino acid transporter n=1 Tax=Allorhizobium taibaishanense TaxID=887144 RepID=A0A1Q9A0V1_9HYPH|nr:hypothetical protein [Allorhizobium taibaishanense]MBB4007759.1 hypothetical protein [Allorhizobium taibaishanense]OLP48107.1 hypothetical protein BJF91_08100 [Allorhizobium taibaishanense]
MTVVHNERTKFVANAFDRASTSCLTVGVFAPIAAALYTPATAVAHVLPFILSAICWLFAAAVLHLSGRRILRRLQ